MCSISLGAVRPQGDGGVRMRQFVHGESTWRGKAKPGGPTLGSASCDTFKMKFIIPNTIMQMKDRSVEASGSEHVGFCTLEK